MIIGVPKEIKKQEYRVAITPLGVAEFKKHNHEILVEEGAGEGSSISDEEYKGAGAEIVDKEYLFGKSEMIYKVKEILPEEYKYLREGLIIFTYIHSNAHRNQTDAFIKSKAIGIAYEDIRDTRGNFPLLRPMSEIAGKGGFLAACQFVQKIHGGAGIMPARVYGVPTPHVVIVGAGYAGLGAAELASAFGNKVTLLDISFDKLEQAKVALPSNVELLYSNEANISDCLKKADILINCVLWPKDRMDHLVTRQMVRTMKKGALIVDVSCDEGGAIETCRSTSHDDPVYMDEGIMHYCVDNIPSAFSKTATYALTGATLP